MTRTKKQNLMLTGASLLALSFASSAALAQDEMTFNIDAQPLAKALLDFNEQSGLTVAAPRNLVEDKIASEVHGEMEPDEALQKILTDTGLKSTELPTGAYTITLASAEEAPGRTEPFRVAQLDQEDAGDVETVSDALDDGDDNQKKDEIVVTGTNIRGAAPVGSQILVLDREAIDKSGFSTAQQILQSLPQTFGAGPNEDTRVGGGLGNTSQGSSVNLRGLGADATLTLVNGRRLPVSGAFSNFVDISTIPLVAIERIEVLPDGASAIYGSDAIGGVVNIVLRDDFDGAASKFRFGTVTEGSSEEFQASQIFGTAWTSGNALIAYEYYDRSNLASADRAFTSNSDLSTLGGSDFGQPFSNPGNIFSPFTFAPEFGIPSGQDGTGLTNADLLPGELNSQNTQSGTDLLGSRRRHSVFAYVTQELSDRFELFAEGRYSNRKFERHDQAASDVLFVPDTNPFSVNPFAGVPVTLVGYSFFDDLGPEFQSGDVESFTTAIGGNLSISESWNFELFGSYNEEKTERRSNNLPNRFFLNAALADLDPSTAFNPFGEGSNTNPATIELIRGFSQSTIDSDVWMVRGKADGTLFSIPGGEVKLALGGEYREEGYRSGGVRFTSTDVPTAVDAISLTRNVYGLFGEILVPVVGAENSFPGVRSLDVSFAVRYEDYSDFGETANPKVGVRWEPLNGFALRGSWGTSFNAPNLTDTDDLRGRFLQLFPAPDPSSATGSTLSLLIGGGNSDLQEETATSWSAGFDFNPPSLSGFSVSFNYYDIEFVDRIEQQDNVLIILPNEDVFAPLITRNPDPAVIQSAFNDPNFFGSPTDPTLVGAIIDLRLRNLAETNVNGMDFNIGYGFETDIGDFQIDVSGNYILTFEEAISATAPIVDVVDTIGNPVALRMRNSASWKRGGLSATAFLNYFGSYHDDRSLPTREIDAWTTVDLQFAYDTGSRTDAEIFRDIKFSVSVLNLFNEDPPFANNALGIGFDPVNSDPLGRFISFEISKTW